MKNDDRIGRQIISTVHFSMSIRDDYSADISNNN